LFASAGVIGSLAGIAARGTDLSVVTRVFLVLALLALAAGALFGLSVAYPKLVNEVVKSNELRQALEPDEWDRPADDHLIRASRARIKIAEEARATNNQKAGRLRIGVWWAGGGIILLLTAAISALA
jgi:hypothetical protein